MASESALVTDVLSGESSNQDAQPPPASIEHSGDLLSDNTAEGGSSEVPAAQDLSANTVAPDVTTDESLDPQPAAGPAPVTENSSGIAPVASFIPADANLDQPTLTPSEPLATGEASTGSEPATAPSEVPPVGTTESADATLATSSEQNVDEMVIDESVAKTDSSSTGEPKMTPPASTDGTEDVKMNPAASTAESADLPMSDAPSFGSGNIRPREDDEVNPEPVAKRTKIEGENGDMQTEFKKPEPPIPAAASTNGNGVVHTPKAPSFSTNPISHQQKTVLLDKMKNTKKVKSAFWFLKPVDIVALNIPHYPNVVKHPMDLSTMEQKLKSDQYASLDDFVADFELIVANCITFNGPQHAASIAGQNLRAYFMKQMETVPTGNTSTTLPQRQSKKASPAVSKPSPVATPTSLPRRESRASAGPGAARSPTGGETFALLPGGTPMIRRDSTAGRPKRAVIPPAPRDLPYTTSKPKRKENQMGIKFCEHILDEFRKPKYDKIAGAFRSPVDPVALNIPMYFSVIKHPMDFQTMTNKIKGDQYSTAAEFKSDLDLIFSNCFKFNPADNIVHQMGKDLQKEVEREWSKKDAWIKKNAPQSKRASSVSDVGSDEESDDAEDDGVEMDHNEATIAALRQQLADMQNMLGNIAGVRRSSPGNKSSKKKKSVSGKSSKKSGAVAPVSSRNATVKSSKPKKQRLVTYEEKQEISTATEKMNEEQIGKLTTIITENVAKYKDVSEEDIELEIDELPNEVQHKLLKYVRTLFPPSAPTDDGNAIDDDYEPERPSARSGGAKKKHKPMKKHEQESRIKQLKEQMASMSGTASAAANAPSHSAQQSSSDEDSESSEEE